MHLYRVVIPGSLVSMSDGAHFPFGRFFFFPLTHQAMWGKPTSKGTPMEKGLAGAIAVCPEVATITTLELAKIGLQLDKAKQYNNSGMALAKSVWNKVRTPGDEPTDRRARRFFLEPSHVVSPISRACIVFL